MRFEITKRDVCTLGWGLFLNLTGIMYAVGNVFDHPYAVWLACMLSGAAWCASLYRYLEHLKEE